MRGGRHLVWFERAVAPALEADVPTSFGILGPGSDDDVYAGVEDAVGIVAGVARYGAAVMERAPRLRVITRTGIGYDKVDVEAATARGIVVCNTPDGPTVSTAEHAVALMLAAGKALIPASKAWAAGDPYPYQSHRGVEFDGKALGLVGFGRIARRVARAGAALGMEIVAFDPHLPAETFTVRRVAELGDLLEIADVVSVHVPLTPETTHLLGGDAFARMKRGAILVNTARGGVVDQEALLAALDSGRLAAAALDVTDPEPLPADHPLLHRADVIVTPHVASSTGEGRRRIFRAAVRQVEMALDGAVPEHVVNPEVLTRAVTSRGVG